MGMMGGGGGPGMATGGSAERGQGAGQAQAAGGRQGQQAGGRGGAARVLPKDQQDRLLFDAQSATFFNYLIEKAGIDKVKDVVRQNMEGKDSLTIIVGFLGSDFNKVEKDWLDWLKTQKPQETGRGFGSAR